MAGSAATVPFITVHGNERRFNDTFNPKVVKVHTDVSNARRSLASMEAPLGRITGAASEFEKSLGAANARVVAFGASVGILFGLSRALQDIAINAIEVEKRLTEIQVIGGQTNEQLLQLRSTIFSVARDTASSFDDVSSAALEFSRQGLNAVQTAEAISSAMKFVRTTGTDLDTAIQAITASFIQFQGKGLTFASIVDKISAADTIAAVSSQDIAEAIKRTGNIAAQAGLQFEELNALITGVAERTQQSGSVVGNAFKTIIARIQADSGVRNTIEGLGVRLEDENGVGRNLVEVLKEIGEATERFSNRGAIFENIAGKRQVDRFVALINVLDEASNGTSRYSEILEASANSAGIADRRNQALQKTISQLVGEVKIAGQELGLALTDGVFEAPAREILGNARTLLQSTRNSLTGEGFERADPNAKGFSGFFDNLEKEAERNAGVFGGEIAKRVIAGFGKAFIDLGIPAISIILLKLVKDFANFAVDSVKSVLGLNKVIQTQSLLQQEINLILTQRPDLIIRSTDSVALQVTKQRELINILNSELNTRREIAKTAANTAATASPLFTTNKGSGLINTGSTSSAARSVTPNAVPQTALEAAIQAEMAMGLKPNQIRINQGGKFRNGQNPLGLAVTNTRDEPTGVVPNFARQLPFNQRTNPELESIAGGSGIQAEGARRVLDARNRLLSILRESIKVETETLSIQNEIKTNLGEAFIAQQRQEFERSQRDDFAVSGGQTNRRRFDPRSFRTSPSVSPEEVLSPTERERLGNLERLKAELRGRQYGYGRTESGFRDFSRQASQFSRAPSVDMGRIRSISRARQFEQISSMGTVRPVNVQDNLAGMNNEVKRGTGMLRSLFDKFSSSSEKLLLLSVATSGLTAQFDRNGGALESFAAKTTEVISALTNFVFFASILKQIMPSGTLGKIKDFASTNALGTQRQSNPVGTLQGFFDFSRRTGSAGGAGGAAGVSKFGSALAKVGGIALRLTGALGIATTAAFLLAPKFIELGEDFGDLVTGMKGFRNQLDREAAASREGRNRGEELGTRRAREFLEQRGRRVAEGASAEDLDSALRAEASRLETVAARLAGARTAFAAFERQDFTETRLKGAQFQSVENDEARERARQRIIEDFNLNSTLDSFEELSRVFNSVNEQSRILSATLENLNLSQEQFQVDLSDIFNFENSLKGQSFLAALRERQSERVNRLNIDQETAMSRLNVRSATNRGSDVSLRANIETLEAQQTLAMERRRLLDETLNSLLAEQQVLVQNGKLTEAEANNYRSILESATSIREIATRISNSEEGSGGIGLFGRAREILLNAEEQNQALDRNLALSEQIIEIRRKEREEIERILDLREATRIGREREIESTKRRLDLEREILSINQEVARNALESRPMPEFQRVLAGASGEIGFLRREAEQRREARGVETSQRVGEILNSGPLNMTTIAQMESILREQRELNEQEREVLNLRIQAIRSQSDVVRAERIRSGEGFRVGINDTLQNFQTEGLKTELGQTIPNAFRDGMFEAMDGAIRRGENLGTVLLNVATNFLNAISQASLNFAANKITGSVFSGFSGGGPVTSGSGVRDDVPAMLMGGEYVIRKDAARQLGKPMLDALNSGRIRGYANGGEVQDFFMPGTRGQGDITGRDNLLKFAQQRTTSGATDILKSNGSSLSIDLEDQSRKLSTFALAGNNRRANDVSNAQGQAFGIITRFDEAVRQRREQIRAQRKAAQQQLFSSLIGLAGSAAIGFATSGFGNPSISGGQYNSGITGGGQNLPASTRFDVGTGSFGGMGVGFAANGGLINRGSGVRDDVPTMLMRGEYVMTKRAVERYGPQFFERINKMADGGSVGSNNDPVGVENNNGGSVTKLVDLLQDYLSKQQPQVNINIQSDGKTSVTTQGSPRENDKELTQKIASKVKEVLIQEKRNGGILAN